MICASRGQRGQPGAVRSIKGCVTLVNHHVTSSGLREWAHVRGHLPCSACKDFTGGPLESSTSSTLCSKERTGRFEQNPPGHVRGQYTFAHTNVPFPESRRQIIQRSHRTVVYVCILRVNCGIHSRSAAKAGSCSSPSCGLAVQSHDPAADSHRRGIKKRFKDVMFMRTCELL